MSGVGSSQNIPGTLGFFRPSVPTQDSSRALPATTLNFSSKYQALMVKLSFEYVFDPL